MLVPVSMDTMTTNNKGARIDPIEVKGVVVFPNHWMITAPCYIIIPFNNKSLQKSDIVVNVNDG